MVVRIHPGQLLRPPAPVTLRRLESRSLLLTLILTAAWGSGGGRGGAEGVGAQQVADSVALHESAREAQYRFEGFRLRHSPVADPGWGGSCDELIGRLCLRLVDTGDWWPGPSDPAIEEARGGLLGELARVSRALPGDRWVLGQRAFYLAEAGLPEDILPALERCALSPPWWCDALAGFALHRAHRFEEAAAAFGSALAAMPPDEAARWTDPRPVLDRDGREFLDRAPDRGDVARRFWALSDPLFLVPGNDRWTEHLARRVESVVRQGARNGYGLRWDRDLTESLVRYGSEAGWEVRRPGPGEAAGPPSGVGQHHPELRSHVAPGRALRGIAATVASDWNPGERFLPRSGYAPSYAPVLLPVEGVVRRVPRGDEVIVVALIDLPADTSYHADHDHPPLPRPRMSYGRSPGEFGLFAADSSGTVVARDRRDDGRLMVRLQPGRYLLSAEVWAPDSLRAGRRRAGFEWTGVPRDLPVVSDLFLADTSSSAPETLEALLPLLRTGEQARSFVPGEAVTVAWELFGLGWTGPEDIRYELVFEEASGGFFRRAGRALGLVGDPWRQELAWSEPGPAAPGPFLRTARLTLPGDMDPGDYLLRLSVELRGRQTMVTEQAVQVGVGRDAGTTSR